MSKNILITGGAGFIGINLSYFLLEKNYNVMCLDNFSTGNINNVIELKKQYPLNYNFIEGDICDYNFSPTKMKIDQIYNLACPASPIYYQSDPIQTIRSCTLGIFNIINFTKIINARILHTSTSEVYGDALMHPQKEEYWGNVNPIGIRSCYDEGKRCAETIFFDTYRKDKIRMKIVRIFNTYGPYMQVNDGRVVSNFIVQALKNEDITIYGYGEQTRSFCYISDLVYGLYKIMNTPKKVIGPINIGNPYEITIKQLAEYIIKKTNSKSKIIFTILPKDDPRKRKPDITYLKEVTYWQPNISIVKGLGETIKYFQGIIEK